MDWMPSRPGPVMRARFIPTPPKKPVVSFCVSMFIQTFAPLLYAYTPECYPTEIRNSGSGIGYGVGRLANGFGPLIVAFLFTHYGYMSVFVYIAATWLMAAIIISAFGPKTKGRTLV